MLDMDVIAEKDLEHHRRTAAIVLAEPRLLAYECACAHAGER
jgi:hypothetical protein